MVTGKIKFDLSYKKIRIPGSMKGSKRTKIILGVGKVAEYLKFKVQIFYLKNAHQFHILLHKRKEAFEMACHGANLEFQDNAIHSVLWSSQFLSNTQLRVNKHRQSGRCITLV